jgi:hypothetical protein
LDEEVIKRTIVYVELETRYKKLEKRKIKNLNKKRVTSGKGKIIRIPQKYLC